MTSRDTQSSKVSATVGQVKHLADRIVSSMRAQGYQDVECVLSECHVKVMASATGNAQRTLYLSFPEFGAQQMQGYEPRAATPPKQRRFVL